MSWINRVLKTIAPSLYLLGIFFIALIGVAMFGASYFVPSGDMRDFLKAVGGFILAGGVFAYILKSLQFLGVYTEALKDIVYFNEDFLSKQGDLRAIHENVVKAVIGGRFPELKSKISEAVLDEFLISVGDCYYDSLERVIKILDYDKARGVVTIADTLTATLVPVSKKAVNYETTLATGGEADLSATVKSEMKVDGRLVSPITSENGARGVRVEKYKIELKGSDSYNLRRSSTITQNLNLDSVLLVLYTHFARDQKIRVCSQVESLFFDFTPLGVSEARIDKDSDHGGETTYAIRGLTFPRQGYILQICRK